MPTNLYGNNDNFNLLNSHVLPALIRKFHLAKLLSENKKDLVYKNLMQDCTKSESECEALLKQLLITRDFVGIWGSGKPRRSFYTARTWQMQVYISCKMLISPI